MMENKTEATISTTEMTPVMTSPSLPPEERRGRTSTACSRGCSTRRPMRRCSRRSPAADRGRGDGGIAAAWRELCRGRRRGADAEAVREEYESRFVGTGKAPITLYACAYSVRYTNETPLAALRGELAALGLARRERGRRSPKTTSPRCAT